MAERVNEQVGVVTPEETTDRGLFEFKNKDEDGKPIKEETLASEFDQKSDEEEKQRKKEKTGLKEKLVEKLPGHKDEVAEDTHVQEVGPPHTEEDPEKKGFLDKIKKKLPGKNKTDDHHADEAVPVVAEPAVVEGEEDKKRFLDKIKDKVPGLSSSKASDGKDDHVDK